MYSKDVQWQVVHDKAVQRQVVYSKDVQWQVVHAKAVQ